jgi:hypothetical protein
VSTPAAFALLTAWEVKAGVRTPATSPLDDEPLDTVVYVGPVLSTAEPYKRVRGGWRRFHGASFRAFGDTLTSAQLAEMVVHR